MSTECLGCSIEKDPKNTPGRIVPSWHHECTRSADFRATLRLDFRALVENDGVAYTRAIHEHERADLILHFANRDNDHEVDLTGAYAEIEPTDDLGMERTYYFADSDEGDPLFFTVCEKIFGTRVDGANARKWVVR